MMVRIYYMSSFVLLWDSNYCQISFTWNFSCWLWVYLNLVILLSVLSSKKPKLFMSTLAAKIKIMKKHLNHDKLFFIIKSSMKSSSAETHFNHNFEIWVPLVWMTAITGYCYQRFNVTFTKDYWITTVSECGYH